MKPFIKAASGSRLVALVFLIALAWALTTPTTAQGEQGSAREDDAVAVEPDTTSASEGPPATTISEGPETTAAIAGEPGGRAGMVEPRPLASPVAPVDGAPVARRAAFDIGAPMAMASFVRDDALWLVFAADMPLDAPGLARQGELGLGTALIAEARGGVALRFDNPGGRRPLIDLDGTEWTVVLPVEAYAPPPPLDVIAEPNHPDGARLFIPDTAAIRPVAFVDPAVGDILVAMPLIAAGRGIDVGRRFAEFRLLPSGLGIVLRPSIDDLRIRATEGGVAITSESGLQLS